MHVAERELTDEILERISRTEKWFDEFEQRDKWKLC